MSIFSRLNLIIINERFIPFFFKYVKINIRNLTATLKILTGVPAVTVWLLLSHYGLRLMCSLSLLQLCWLFMERYSCFKNRIFQKNPNAHCGWNAGNSCWMGGGVKTSRNTCQVSKYLAILLCQEVWIFSGITQWNGVLVNILWQDWTSNIQSTL